MITNPLNTQNSMTLNEMKEELEKLESTAWLGTTTEEEYRMAELKHMINEWEAELSKIGW